VKRIGVRFCGGCNPRYDRGAAFRRIKRALESASETPEIISGEILLDHAVEGTPYDGLLVIGGCQACCAGYDQFHNQGPVVKLDAEEGIPVAVQKLAELTTK
jgi:hypothetical protein